MSTTLTLISAVYIVAFLVLAIEMIAAPEGYQDARGFHLGDEPPMPRTVPVCEQVAEVELQTSNR